MYLLDTNVISELRKGDRAHPGVRAFFATVPETLLLLPAQVIGEIQAGIAKLRREGSEQSATRADALDVWLNELVQNHGRRIVAFDTDCARLWGTLLSGEKKDPHTIDKQIAAIALIHDLTVVTRDMGEAFSRIPYLKAYNPFVDPIPSDEKYTPAS